MEQIYLIQLLIWLFPIMFILHDFEELIMTEKWMKRNANLLIQKLPTRIADRAITFFSKSTAQLSTTVLVIFVFVSCATIMANQYIIQGLLGDIYFFTIVTLAFFLHAFTHIAQSIILRSITPGVITSVLVIIPYSLVLYSALFANEIITWKIIFISLPFCAVLFPIILLFAHWVGKKVV